MTDDGMSGEMTTKGQLAKEIHGVAVGLASRLNNFF